MRKFLSLVLALVMMMSLVTINAGAKEFKDDDDVTYDEAVAVISTIGVVDGYTDGSFKPGANLTRGAAAKIICNMILGPTTAAELHADTAPYRDVPLTNEFAGYIAYCQKEGIINGYNDGTFRPGGTLTGYAFMKMLLGALGYDGEIEQYTGPNWSINVAKRAIGIGLNAGLDKTFNGVDFITREEAALYAFNTLQADLVEYSSKITANVNGAEVTVGNSNASSRTWQSQMSRNDYIREDEIIQFAEEYFNKLEKRKGRDDFERPAYTWVYDKEEIGTYVDWSLMVEQYTTAVTGRELYDLLGATAIRDNDLVYYVNGLIPTDAHPMHTSTYDNKRVGAASDITEAELVRSNKEDLGISANGVLTQVFLDKDDEIITITSIDTFLAKALADYDEDKEYAPFEVYTGITGASDNRKTTKTTFNVDVEDVKSIVDVQEGDYELVNITFKNDNKGTVVAMTKPEIMDESVVTKFSKANDTIADKVTTGGTEYKASMRAFFSDNALNEYDQTLLTDKTYNIFMDAYGYFIGIELYEGAQNYVFITGFDRPTSNLSISTATAAAIFLDGTMQNITVNVKATNSNIRAVNGWKTGVYNAANVKNSGQYFIEWDEDNLPGKDGSYRYNRWFTYSVNAAGVYTLTPCTRMTATKYADATTIRTDNLYVDDNVYVNADTPYGLKSGHSYNTTIDGSHYLDGTSGTTNYKYTTTNNERSYGNDDTVFLTVSLDETDTVNQARAISDVDGVYTGVQNIEIEIDPYSDMEEAQIYTVYNSDHYMIAAITVGEAKGANATIAYVMSEAKSERIEGDTYYWEFDAILDGTVQTLTVKGKYDLFQSGVAVINDEMQKKMVSGSTSNLNDGLVELRFDTDKEYVTDVKQVAEKDIYNFYGRRYPTTNTPALKGANSITTIGGFSTVAGSPGRTSNNGTAETLDLRDAKAYRMNVIRNNWTSLENSSTVNHYYDSAPSELYLQGRTLYVTKGQIDEGLALASDAKAVVIQKENGKNNVVSEFSSVATALRHIADADINTTALEFDGEVIAVMNDKGAAAWVVFKTDRELYTGTSSGGSGRVRNVLDARYQSGVLTTVGGVTYNGRVEFTLDGTLPGETYTVVLSQLANNGTWVDLATRTVVSGNIASENLSWPINRTSFPYQLNSGTYRVTCNGKYDGFNVN